MEAQDICIDTFLCEQCRYSDRAPGSDAASARVLRLPWERVGVRPCARHVLRRVEVAEGNEAGLAREKMVHGEVGSEARMPLRDGLLAYCKQDTLAMVRLVEVLRGA